MRLRARAVHPAAAPRCSECASPPNFVKPVDITFVKGAARAAPITRRVGAQPAPNIGGAIMNIGEPLRIIEVEPLWIPLPDAAPAPTEQPVREPEQEPEPAIPVP